MKEYSYADNVFSFEGSVSVQVDGTWCRPWRINYNRIDLFPHVSDRAGEASGVRLCFTTDSLNIGLKIHELFENMKMDVYSNGKLTEQYTCGQSKDIKFLPMDPGMKSIEIWLDPRFPFILENVIIDDDAQIQPTKIIQKRWVHYGSSISHSKHAGSPSTTWTGIVARKYNFHLTNLGYGGQCKIDPMIGLMIRNLPADMVTLKLGINCYKGDLSPRTFESNAIGLVNIIRDKKPDIPLVVISPIHSPNREESRVWDNSMTLMEMRNMLLHVVEKFKKYGDQNIYYVDGLKILGLDKAEYLPDDLHPNAEGQFIMAENFTNEVLPNL